MVFVADLIAPTSLTHRSLAVLVNKKLFRKRFLIKLVVIVAAVRSYALKSLLN